MIDNQNNGDSRSLKPVDFSELILSFASAALYHLGDPSLELDVKDQKNMSLAKHNLDIIELLKAKTQGNLSDQESALIHEITADLQRKISATN